MQSPHQTPEIKEIVDQAHEVFDRHSAVSVALYLGYTAGKSVSDLARQISDQTGRKGHVNRVKEEIERRVKSVQSDLESALLNSPQSA